MRRRKDPLADRIKARFDKLKEQHWNRYAEILTDVRLQQFRARAEQEVQAEAERDFQMLLRPTLRRMETGQCLDTDGGIGAYHEYVDLLAQRHGVTVVWLNASAFPAGASAYADWDTGVATTPHIRSERDLAVALHEIGHLIAGPCEGEGHYRNPHERAWWHCLACETAAWRIALFQLAPTEKVVRIVHSRLTTSLRSYRERTPGPTGAFRALDELSGDVSLLEAITKRRLGLDYYRMKIGLPLKG